MNKKFPKVISFYTLNTPYQSEIQNLVSSCEKYKIEYEIEGVNSFGTWELNCAYKPFFIYKKLMELKTALLWVDADGIFLKSPKWIEAFDADFSARIHENLAIDHPSKVISSTLFVQFNERAIQLVKLWAKECEKQLLDPSRAQEFWDQIALSNALFSKFNNANFKSLPLTYAKIFDHPHDNQEISEIVIEHFQASRRFKHLV